MEIDEILKISATILASLGGGAIVIGAFAKWFGDLWAKRLVQSHKQKLDEEIESYKVKLKKSEFIFQKEYEAASELVALIRSFLPGYLHPNMDWNEACEHIADMFGYIEKDLNNYLSKHGAVLNKDTVNLISSCIHIAGENKFESNSSTKSADNLYNKLKEAEQAVLAQVHSQSST